MSSPQATDGRDAARIAARVARAGRESRVEARERAPNDVIEKLSHRFGTRHSAFKIKCLRYFIRFATRSWSSARFKHAGGLVGAGCHGPACLPQLSIAAFRS